MIITFYQHPTKEYVLFAITQSLELALLEWLEIKRTRAVKPWFFFL